MIEKFLKENLIKEYPYKTEMHAHSFPASGCSEVSPEQLVKIYADLGYNSLVLTNHFIHKNGLLAQYEKSGIELWYDEYKKAKAYGQECGLNVILGAEIRFTENDNDYLIYGLNKQMLKEIYEYLPFGVENFRKKYKMPDSVFMQAHPFRDNCKPIRPELLDGIETLNMHQGHNSRIAIATEYACEHNLPVVSAGTDFHHLGRKHEGAAALRSKEEITDSFQLAKVLKSGDYLLEIGGSAIVLP